MIFFLLSITILSLSTSQAAIYKGQRVFKKKCITCHDNPQAFVAKHTKKEWNVLMQNNGTPLKELHIKSKKAEKSHKYFDSKSYTKKTKHLSQFLVEYAKDSGKVPAFD
jgi:cytochrome c2